MSDWSFEQLGSLCYINIGRTPSRNRPEYWGDGHAWLSIADMGQGRHLHATKEQISEYARPVMGVPVDVGTVVMSFKLSIGKVGIVRSPMFTNEAIAALPVIDDSRLDRDYLYWALRSIDVTAETDDAAMGKTLNKKKLARINFPLPVDIHEQQYIANVLNNAERLIDTRKVALKRLDDLRQAVFVKNFGDPSTADSVGTSTPLGDLLVRPLRGGKSPSSNGTIERHVLTLSSITGARFQANARKRGLFEVEPSNSHRVNRSDFLVCRGNGNLALVGRGAFPTTDMPEIVFPDTAIAARVDVSRIIPEFLEEYWKTPYVRYQVEKAARTTNGTHKINQTALAAVDVKLPDPAAQADFAVEVEQIRSLRVLYERHLETLEQLLSNLQASYFNR